MQNESITGNNYFMLLVDDCTRMMWVYFLRYKSDALNCFRKFKSMVELQSGFRVKCLRSDRRGEFTSCEFSKLCEDECIQRQLSMAYTSQQNGVVERKNINVVEMAKAMLHDKVTLLFGGRICTHNCLHTKSMSYKSSRRYNSI